MKDQFRKFSHKISCLVGTPGAFVFAIGMVLVWAAAGPFAKFSDSWELVINTATTIITFLMVFVIQNTQNRDMKSLQLKLDELIRATKDARNKMISLERLSEDDLDNLEKEFQELKHEDVLILRTVEEPDGAKTPS